MSSKAPVGGQAVVEGVMVRGASAWAVAVRHPDGTVRVSAEPFVSWARRSAALRWPVIRGLVALGEALKIGYRALRISAEAQRRGEMEMARAEGREPEAEGEVELGDLAWGLTIAASLAFAVGVFFIVPVTAAILLRGLLGSLVLFLVVEGLLRTGLLVGYLWLISRAHDMRSLFEYHGAEHKAIACYEAGASLTPENAERCSRLHPRCGTSFLLTVMVLSVFVLAPIGLPAWYWLLLSRVAGIPVVAALAYELIRLSARHRSSRWARGLAWPGLMLQRLTTREPDRDQLAVAIAALEEVLGAERRAEHAPREPEVEAVA